MKTNDNLIKENIQLMDCSIFTTVSIPRRLIGNDLETFLKLEIYKKVDNNDGRYYDITDNNEFLVIRDYYSEVQKGKVVYTIYIKNKN